MASSRSLTPYSLGQSRNGSFHDSRDETRKLPEAFISPNSSKQDSLKLESPSRRVLFSYQHVLFLCRKSAISLLSLIRNKTTPEPTSEPVTKSNVQQQRSIMSLKVDRLKDKWHGLKTRTSPSRFRCAGYIFLVVVVIVLGSIIVGWYGLSKDTLAHQTVTLKPPTATPTAIEFHGPFWPTQTPVQGQSYSLAHRDNTTISSIPATHAFAITSQPTAPIEEREDITVARTIIVTVTSVITDMEVKTLTTTVFGSTCTTCITTPTTGSSADTIDSESSTTTASIMTGIMYCSFTGRRNIYTLCPLVHTNSPAMLTGAPAMVSSATPRMKNSFSAVRLGVLSLWNSIPSLGRVMQANEREKCDCDCVGLKKKLDAAVDLIRLQQQLLDSQRTMINEHRRGFFVVLETLANMTVERVGEGRSRNTPLDLNI
ncbi:hypothetical protein F5Y12DRAFT_712021 [Xylaria sp. FL1777]|nr:hypothetical protein F5Y12DRAFT_712021 [Xylaria sp. FL1777]